MDEKTISRRLEELKAEFEAGQKMMTELDEKRERLRESLLRISGAIQVLEEVAGEEKEAAEGES